MKFRLGRYTRDILLNHVFDKYGQLLNEMTLIVDGEDIKGKIIEIIRKYSSKMFKDHYLELRPSPRTNSDYIIILKKKRQIETK